MSDAFVPLFAKGPNGSEPSPEFARLKVRPSPPVSVATEPVASTALSVAPSAPQNCQNHAAPRVTVQRDGDKITGIKIDCSCGQVILLDCTY